MIRLALFGASPFAKESHAPALRANKDLFTVVAIYNRCARCGAGQAGNRGRNRLTVSCRRSPAPAAALAQDFVSAGLPQPEVHSGEDETVMQALLARPDIHAVSVVLASHVQPDFVRAALRAGPDMLHVHP